MIEKLKFGAVELNIIAFLDIWVEIKRCEVCNSIANPDKGLYLSKNYSRFVCKKCVTKMKHADLFEE